jgi:hypothetical protein
MSNAETPNPQIFLPPYTYMDAVNSGAGRIVCDPDELLALGFQMQARGGNNLPAAPANLAIIPWRHSLMRRDPHFNEQSADRFVPSSELPKPFERATLATKANVLAAGRLALEVQIDSFAGGISLSGDVARSLASPPPEDQYMAAGVGAWLRAVKETFAPAFTARERDQVAQDMVRMFPNALRVEKFRPSGS